MLPIKSINNSILSNKRATPLKDSTSTNEHQFSRDRNEISNIPISNNKKWFGNSSNRDASSRIRSKRIEASANSINKDNKPLSFTNTNEKNLINHTLLRVRGSGYTVPPKGKVLSN
jgi:hypothetical protein